MNLLIDVVPTSVNIDGEDYKINSDFRTSILFELMMQDNDLSEEEKVTRALELYYDTVPNNLTEAVENMLWFYRCDKEIREAKGKGTGKSYSQIYSFDYDDDYIYSAFLDQYNIDLQDIDYLHWWKFKAMFKSLKEDNEIVKIMGYRAIDLSKIKDKEQRAFYNSMKTMYEIPKSKNESEKINAIEEALLRSGDVSNIL